MSYNTKMKQELDKVVQDNEGLEKRIQRVSQTQLAQQKEMLKDSKDLLDNVEVTTIAQECVKLKQKEDELTELEEQVKNKDAICVNCLSEISLEKEIYISFFD